MFGDTSGEKGTQTQTEVIDDVAVGLRLAFCNITDRRSSSITLFLLLRFLLRHYHRHGAPSSSSTSSTISLLSATNQFVMVLEALSAAAAASASSSSSSSPPSTSNSNLPPPPQDAWTLAYQQLLPRWKSLSHSHLVLSSLALNLILSTSRMYVLFLHS